MRLHVGELNQGPNVGRLGESRYGRETFQRGGVLFIQKDMFLDWELVSGGGAPAAPLLRRFLDHWRILPVKMCADDILRRARGKVVGPDRFKALRILAILRIEVPFLPTITSRISSFKFDAARAIGFFTSKYHRVIVLCRRFGFDPDLVHFCLLRYILNEYFINTIKIFWCVG